MMGLAKASARTVAQAGVVDDVGSLASGSDGLGAGGFEVVWLKSRRSAGDMFHGKWRSGSGGGLPPALAQIVK